MGIINLGLVDGDEWDAAAVDALEAFISAGGSFGAGAPAGTGSNGDRYWDTTNKRSYRSTGAAWYMTPDGRTPRVKVSKTSVQGLAHNTIAVMTWNGEVYDADGFHDLAVNTSRLTVPAGMAGLYRASYHVFGINEPTSGNDTVDTWVQVNGTGRDAYLTTHTLSSQNFCNTGSCDLVLAAGDYVEVVGYHFSSTAFARNFGHAGVTSMFSLSYAGPSW